MEHLYGGRLLRSGVVLKWVLAMTACAWLIACSEDSRRSATPADGGLLSPSDASGQEEDQMIGDAASQHPTPLADVEIPIPCNGNAALCDRHYDELAYLATHHSAAAGPGWPEPTQHLTITDQLADHGVRGLTLELHTYQGALAICAGDCTRGSAAAASVRGGARLF
jgi:hypothetical protein